jgi:glycosyltransferase involved in cell wall biosynthesis
MTDLDHYFKDVTLLVTHYNRSQSLERLLDAFKQKHCRFEDIVVSDDGSDTAHLKKMRDLRKESSFRLVTAARNGGLGNNLNKGQDAVKTPYTLYVQEDFEPTSDFAAFFQFALRAMNERPELDIVRLYAYVKYPYLKPFGNGYSEMLYKPWFRDYMKIYMYSDHPHLRRSNFTQKFGRYPEGMKGDITEYRMCLSFIQKKGRGLFYEDFQALFHHNNTDDEPSTMTRNNWKQQSSNVFIRFARNSYRQVKYNFDLLFSRQQG